MDKDTLKGKAKDVKGRIKRQVGEWTGREDLQIKGAGEQVEGKVQKGVGKIKEMGRDAMNKMDRERDAHKRDRESRDKGKDVA